MKVDIVSLLEECPDECGFADPCVEEVVTTAFGATTLSVIVDCPHRPVCEMWKEEQHAKQGCE